MNKLSIQLEEQEWFRAMIDECKSIIGEAEWKSRWDLLEGYHLLGKRICEENDNFQRNKIYGKKIVQCIAISLNKHTRTIYNAIEFYKKYPILNEVPEGKAISWYKICNKYLPNSKKDNPEKIITCPQCGFRIKL